MDAAQRAGEGRVVVIGGGLGGIAAALRLRAKGYDVVLVEKSERLGGIAAVFEENGIRGFYPLAFGDYSLFEPLFSLHDKKVEDYVDVISQNGMRTRFVFDDRSTLDLGDLEFSLAEMAKRGPGHVEQLQQLYDFSRHIMEPPSEPVAGATALDFKRSFAEVVASFIDDESVQMAINYRTSLLGENPYAISSFYLMMLHMQEVWGSFTARGGIDGLVRALERLMLDVGIEVVKGDAAVSLECEENRVREVLLQTGRRLPSSHLISNMSPYHLYSHLLTGEDGAGFREQLGDAKYSPSIFSYHFRTNRPYPDLPAMMVLFPGDFGKFCSQLHANEAMPDELMLGVYRVGFYDRSFAADGEEHFSVYFSVPNLRAKVRWEEVSAQLVEDIVARLEEYLLPNLSNEIVDAFYRTPLDMQSECSLPYGAAFGRQLTKADGGKEFFPTRDPEIRNLYLVGHNTSPGPGLNAVLMSAQSVSDRIRPQG